MQSPERTLKRTWSDPTERGNSLMLSVVQAKEALGIAAADTTRDAFVLEAVDRAHSVVTQALQNETTKRVIVDYYRVPLQRVMRLSQRGVSTAVGDPIVVKYRDRGHTEQTADASSYDIEISGSVGLLHWREVPGSLAGDLYTPVTVQYTAGGSGAFKYPAAVRQAITITLQELELQENNNLDLLIRTARRLCQGDIAYG